MTLAQRIWYWFSPETREDIEALDKRINGLTGGDPDETVTDRAARSMERGEFGGALACGVFNALDPGHCQRALDAQRRREQA